MLDVRPLQSSTFRHLAASYWVNQLGNWLGEIALAILVFDRTGSPLATATLFVSLRFLPALLAPLLTVRVEALPPRAVLGCLYMVEAVFFAGMAVLVHHFSLPALLGLCALDGTLAIVATALARAASATWLLNNGLLRQGNALMNLGTMACSAAGPALAGLAVAWKGASTALMIDAASFVVAAVIISSAPGLRLESDRGAGFSGRLQAGYAVLRDYAAVRRLLIAIAFVMMFASLPIPIEVVFAQKTLHAGARGYGFLLGAWGVGMIVGATGFAVATRMRLIRVLGAGTALTVVGYAGLAISPTLAIACAFSAVGGSGNGAAWVAAVTAIQERIPISTQGAVMAVLEGINQVMPAIGFAIGGAITAASSPRDAYAVSAAGVALMLVAVALRPIDRVRLSGVPQARGVAVDIGARLHQTDRNAYLMAQELLPATRTLSVSDR
jgi:Transmembrane secretion effector